MFAGELGVGRVSRRTARHATTSTVRLLEKKKTQKNLQGTSRLSRIIKNASSREDPVAPKQANKNSTALIME